MCCTTVVVASKHRSIRTCLMCMHNFYTSSRLECLIFFSFFSSYLFLSTLSLSSSLLSPPLGLVPDFAGQRQVLRVYGRGWGPAAVVRAHPRARRRCGRRTQSRKPQPQGTRSKQGRDREMIDDGCVNPENFP